MKRLVAALLIFALSPLPAMAAATVVCVSTPWMTRAEWATGAGTMSLPKVGVTTNCHVTANRATECNGHGIGAPVSPGGYISTMVNSSTPDYIAGAVMHSSWGFVTWAMTDVLVEPGQPCDPEAGAGFVLMPINDYIALSAEANAVQEETFVAAVTTFEGLLNSLGDSGLMLGMAFACLLALAGGYRWGVRTGDL